MEKLYQTPEAKFIKNFKQNSIRQRYIIFNIGEPPSCQSFIQFSFEFTQLYMLANGQANLI